MIWDILKFPNLEYGAVDWVLPKSLEFQNVPNHFRIHFISNKLVIAQQIGHVYISSLRGLVNPRI